MSFSSLELFSGLISLAKPSQFDWGVFLQIDLTEDESLANSTIPSSKTSQIFTTLTADDIDSEKKQICLLSMRFAHTNTAAVSLENVVHPFDEQTVRTIKWWLKFSSIYLVIDVLITIVLQLLPLYRDWISTKAYYGEWVSLAIIWHFFAMSAVIVSPIWDGRNAIINTTHGIARDFGQSRKR
ncbi:hypothetical protein LTR95_011274 [Oleoguttula sp. CCFEE 5521]